MTEAKDIIDEHLKLMGDEGELFASGAKLERLVAVAMPNDPEADKVEKHMADMAGGEGIVDISTDGIAEKISKAALNKSGSEEEHEAAQILDKIRKGVVLLQSGGNLTHGQRLIAEGYDKALMHEGLATIMDAVTPGNANGIGALMEVAAGGRALSGGSGGESGAATLLEVILVVSICGGGILCGYIVLQILANSKLQTSSEEVV